MHWSLQCGGLKGHSDGRAKSIHLDCCSVAARVQRLGALYVTGALWAKSTYLGLGQRSCCSELVKVQLGNGHFW